MSSWLNCIRSLYFERYGLFGLLIKLTTTYNCGTLSPDYCAQLACHSRIIMNSSIEVLAGVIQMAVAPVFLLTGIAGFLNVMSGRLSRIIDRARIVERRMSAGIEDEPRLSMTRIELRTLWRRVKLINWSIGMCTASGLMVCTVVVSLFVGDFWDLRLAEPIIVLFMLALVLLIFALLLFIKEVHLATRLLHVGREFTD